MHAFGWSIEYTLGLTWPVFIDLFELIKRVRLDNAVDGMYIPYSAAKYGKDCARALFDGRGTYYLKGDVPQYTYSEEDVKRARARMRRIQRQRQKAMEAAAVGA